jgi:hypothetical protein
MLEIILLIYLCNKNGKLAEEKNVSKRKWVLTTVLYWLAGEALGIFLLMTINPIDPEIFQGGKEIGGEFLYLMCAGLLGGYLGYLLARKRIEDLPNSNNEIE